MTDTTILVVEDERMIAEDISESLRDDGYLVPMIVDTGEEALIQSIALRPHVILMDIKLRGDWDGIRTAEEILKQHDCPIIYLTAFTDSEIVERAKSTNPFGYVLKPFRHKELRTMIELSLHNHKRAQQNRERQQKVMDLLTHSHEAIIVTDEKGWIQFMNPLAIELSGISDEDRQKHPVSQLLHWCLPPDYMPTDILKTRVNENLLLKRADLTHGDMTLPIKVSASKLHHENKKVSGYILSFFSMERAEVLPESEQDKLLAMCASCKKIRTENGSYINIELFLREKYGFRFSHGICPGCFECLYPDYFTETH
jgi:PAS domain S-box-containing protein